MTKKKALPSDDFINSKKDSFKEYLEQVASGEVDLSTKKETATDKLELIKDELLLLKDKNISYSIISKLLEEKLDLKISEQTLRAFCQSRLGFPKKERRATKAKPVVESNDNYDATNELSNSEHQFK